MDWKVVILPDGDKTKAIFTKDGKKTVVDVTRYHKDKYSIEAAVKAVTEKLFSEVKAEEHESKIKPGDLVEVIESDDRCPEGLRARVYKVEELKHCPNVLLLDFGIEYDFTHNSWDYTKPKHFYWIGEKKVKKVD